MQNSIIYDEGRETKLQSPVCDVKGTLHTFHLNTFYTETYSNSCILIPTQSI